MDIAQFEEIVRKNRSCRRFVQADRIERETLVKLIDLARLTPSAANMQGLRYRIVTDVTECAKVYETLGWAGYLPDWPGPEEGERPSAYIILLNDQTLPGKRDNDVGIAAQTILLGAVAGGYAGCMLGNIRKAELSQALALDPERYAVQLVIALGRPKEKIVLTEVGADGSIRYFRDDDGTHYVPKRKLSDIIV